MCSTHYVTGRSYIGQPSDVGFYDPGNASNLSERIERRLNLHASDSGTNRFASRAMTQLPSGTRSRIACSSVFMWVWIERKQSSGFAALSCRMSDGANCRRTNHFFRLRVRAALRAAAARPAGPFVRTAFRAAAFKDPTPRFRAAERACRASADLEAAARPSRRRAERTAPARLADGLVLDRERLRACCALRRVLSEVVPFSGGASSTPARRAFDRPIATACLGDRAPCFPSRT